MRRHRHEQDIQGAGGAGHLPANIILDTDAGSDPGDIGALRMLHTLQNMGLARIIAVCCAATYQYAAGCVDAQNVYCGRPAIPVGVNKGPDLQPGPDAAVYNQYIAGHFSNRYPVGGSSVPDALDIYQSALNEFPSGSLTVCCIGQLANIAHLISNRPTVAARIGRLVCMAGDYPTGHEYNIYTDWTSAKTVCDSFAGRIDWLGYTPGLTVKTGQAVIDAAVTADPTYWAFKLFKDANPTLVPRESWDQMATLMAVCGLVFDQQVLFESISTAGSNSVDSGGNNTWVASPVKDQRYVKSDYGDTNMAALIDNLQKGIKSPIV